MHRFSLLMVLALIIPDLGIYLAYIRTHFTKKPLYKWLWWVPTILLIASFIIARYWGGVGEMDARQEGIAIISSLVLLTGVPKLVFLLFSVISFPIRHLIKRLARPCIVASIILASAVFGVLLYGNLVGIGRIEVKRVGVSFSKLPPAFNGYRIVQLSDIHAGSFKNRPDILQKMVDSVNALKPDLILFTGDLVNQRAIEIDFAADILAKLYAPDGVYSVLGNHDYGHYFKWADANAEEDNSNHLEEQEKYMGWNLLKNAHKTIYHRGDSIVLIGVENDGNPPFPQRADLHKALDGTSNDSFKIIMSHDPTHWQRAILSKTNIDLTLSGHTHGTQFKIGDWSPASWVYQEWGGLYKFGERQLYVNTGIGYVGLPFRFGAWPEITLLTLNE